MAPDHGARCPGSRAAARWWSRPARTRRPTGTSRRASSSRSATAPACTVRSKPLLLDGGPHHHGAVRPGHQVAAPPVDQAPHRPAEAGDAVGRPSRRVSPLTGRTGGRTPRACRASCPERQPAASTTAPAGRAVPGRGSRRSRRPSPIGDVGHLVGHERDPAGRRRRGGRRPRSRLSTWWSSASSAPPRMPGARSGSAARHSAGRQASGASRPRASW